MRSFLPVISFLSLCLLSFPATAQTAPAANGITLERLMKSGARQFDKLDTNHDGVVDDAEWKVYVEDQVSKLRAHLAKRWTETDVNGDAKVTKEEFLNSRAKWFAEVDADNSGFINSEKIRKYNMRRARSTSQN